MPVSMMPNVGAMDPADEQAGQFPVPGTSTVPPPIAGPVPPVTGPAPAATPSLPQPMAQADPTMGGELPAPQQPGMMQPAAPPAPPMPGQVACQGAPAGSQEAAQCAAKMAADRVRAALRKFASADAQPNTPIDLGSQKLDALQPMQPGPAMQLKTPAPRIQTPLKGLAAMGDFGRFDLRRPQPAFAMTQHGPVVPTPKLAAAADQGKMTQKQAGYTQAANPAQACAACQNYQGPSGCQIVQGPIDPGGTCQYFQPGQQLAHIDPDAIANAGAAAMSDTKVASLSPLQQALLGLTLTGPVLGAGIGALGAPRGHRLEGSGRGAVAGTGARAGVTIGGVGGLLGGAAAGAYLGEQVEPYLGTNSDMAIPLGMAGGAILGGLGGGVGGGIAGHRLANRLMGPPSWERHPEDEEQVRKAACDALQGTCRACAEKRQAQAQAEAKLRGAAVAALAKTR